MNGGGCWKCRTGTAIPNVGGVAASSKGWMSPIGCGRRGATTNHRSRNHAAEVVRDWCALTQAVVERRLRTGFAARFGGSCNPGDEDTRRLWFPSGPALIRWHLNRRVLAVRQGRRTWVAGVGPARFVPEPGRLASRDPTRSVEPPGNTGPGSEPRCTGRPTALGFATRFRLLDIIECPAVIRDNGLNTAEAAMRGGGNGNPPTTQGLRLCRMHPFR